MPFAGCIAFTLVFNIHGPGKLIAGFGGALGWLVYLLGGKTILAGFFAAAAISLFSEIMARLRRCPVTGYQLVALLPLVPGGGIYYAMSYCLAGDTEPLPHRPAGHPGHGGGPGSGGHPGLLPVPGGALPPGPLPEDGPAAKRRP